MKKKIYTISLDPWFKKEIELCAKKMGMSLSEWIRFIARDKLDYFNRHAEKYFIYNEYQIKQETTHYEDEENEEDFEKFLDRM